MNSSSRLEVNIPFESQIILFLSQDNKRTKWDTWATTDVQWLTMNPWGMRRLLVWIKEMYNNPIIYVTENGCNEKHESARKNLDDLINDYFRVDYLRRYINEVMIWCPTVRIEKREFV